ncbi:MAG: hypothetical protein JRJ46_10850 [Deltaproteobacteria bacterium]|nr:hypothetical protein [Deltaproteobacteria bacterium]
MGVAFIWKDEALCDTCYQEAIDFEIHAGREREIPPKTKVRKKECDKCHVELEIEEEF